MRLGDDDGLGLTVDLPVVLIDDLAQKIVDAAAPEIQLLVSHERQRITEGVWKSLPFTGAGAAALLGTIFFLPDQKILKFVGYAVSIGLLIGGIAVFLDHTRGADAPPSADKPAVVKDGQKVYPIKVAL